MLRDARWSGTPLAALIMASALVTPVTYLSTPVSAPTHALWGSEEGPLLVLIGVVGALAAVMPGRSLPRSPR